MGSMVGRPPSIHYSTSHPFRFFGRAAELALLDAALAGGDASLVAMVGPGGQGKTAIVQHWLSAWGGQSLRPGQTGTSALHELDGLFFWSFYRGKDSDLCLRQLLAYAEGLSEPPEVSASYCVDKL